jgi:hypothetical protein
MSITLLAMRRTWLAIEAAIGALSSSVIRAGKALVLLLADALW